MNSEDSHKPDVFERLVVWIIASLVFAVIYSIGIAWAKHSDEVDKKYQRSE